jgi:hypothetical protein
MSSPGEIQKLFDKAFGGQDLVRPRRDPPVEGRRPGPSPENIQLRFNELFGDTPWRPPPPPSPRRPDLSPEDIQQRLNEALGGVLANTWTPGTLHEPPPEPPRKLTPEEVQRRLNDAFTPWEWAKSRPPPGPSPRRLRSLFRASAPETGGPSRISAVRRASRT